MFNYSPYFIISFQFNIPEQLEKAVVLKSQQAAAYSFAKNFIYNLCTLLGCMKQYER